MAIAATSDAGSERGAPREPVVPRLAATVALVRDATGGPEVYLMRRPPTMTFAPGVWVVPGGSVDPLDATTASPTTPATTDRSAWAPTGLSTMDAERVLAAAVRDRKSTRLNSSHMSISYAVFCLKKKKKKKIKAHHD